MKIHFVSGPRRAERVDLRELGMIIGRSDDCDIVVKDDQASREHAKLFAEGPIWFLQDLDSTNGIRVNGVRVAGRQSLRAGDTISIGETQFQLESEGTATASSSRQVHSDATMVVPAAVPHLPGIEIPAEPLKPHQDPPRKHAHGHLTGDEPAAPRGFKAQLIWIVPLLVVLALAGLWLWSGLHQQPTTGLGLPGEEQSSSWFSWFGGGEKAESATPVEIVDEAPDAVDTAAAEEALSVTVDTAPLPDPAAEARKKLQEEARLATLRMQRPGQPARYLWVDSEPSGATVSIDGRDYGQGPVFAADLSDGPHRMRLELPGFAPHEQSVQVPSDGNMQRVELRQLDGTVRITSDPPNAAVLLGKRVLGRTPLLVSGLQTGEYEVQVYAPLYAEYKVTLPVDPVRPVKVHAQLKPAAAGIRVVSIPPGATVLVNGVIRGETKAGDAPPGSAPLLLGGLKPGNYEVSIALGGETSKPLAVTVEEGKVAVVQLGLWLPDTRVITRSGQTIDGILVKRAANGDLTLLDPSLQAIEVKAGAVEQRSPIPLSLARQLRAEQLR